MDTLIEIVQSWQVRTIVGLIVLNVVLGISAAIKNGQFDLGKLANYYKTYVLPYLLGFIAFYLVLKYIIPEDSFVYGEYINEVAVDTAWVTLVATLGKNIYDNFLVLYGTQEEL